MSDLAVEPRRRFAALPIAHGVIAGAGDTLRRLRDRGTLRPGGIRQVAAFEALAAALLVAGRASLQHPTDPPFAAAFAPLAALFEAADAAARDGGYALPDLFAGGITRSPFPTTPASCAWFCTNAIACCLMVIVRTPAAATPKRRMQLGTLLALRDALDPVIGRPPSAAELARIDAAFVQATAWVAAETRAIEAEAVRLALDLAEGAGH